MALFIVILAAVRGAMIDCSLVEKRFPYELVALAAVLVLEWELHSERL